MKYRPHRRTLDESMAEMVDVTDRAALVKHLAANLRKWRYNLTDNDVRVEPYGYDDRIGWDTHIVTIKNQKLGEHWYFGKTIGPDYYGAIGFTDGAA